MQTYKITDSGTGARQDEKRFGIEVSQSVAPMQLLQFVAGTLSNLGWQTDSISQHPDNSSQLVLPARIAYDVNRFGVASGTVSTNTLAWNESGSTNMVMFFQDTPSAILPWLSAAAEAAVIRALGEVTIQLHLRKFVGQPMSWQPVLGRWAQNQTVRLSTGDFLDAQR